MKTLTAVTALILSVLFICGAKAPDTPVYEYKVDGIYIHDITVAELEDFYRIYGYNDYIYMRDLSADFSHPSPPRLPLN